ncbi:hypothetical protein [Polycladospora coralii]|uniref:hypothetical protein n=1 Tax=Polycladospora coralii TaxID=2771432 RepID=UPI001CD16563|nr:hypothetical protein [Polycladospora coralii]
MYVPSIYPGEILITDERKTEWVKFDLRLKTQTVPIIKEGKVSKTKIEITQNGYDHSDKLKQEVNGRSKAEIKAKILE